MRLIATGVPAEQIDKSLKPGDLNFIARTKDAYVYENPRALPRVMLVGDWKVADFDKLTPTGWPPDVDPQKTVLLERRLASHRRLRAGGHRAACALRQHRGRRSRSTRRPAALLVLNDVWHPWWRATIDGVETEIMRANVIFRAVAVPPGKSHGALHLRAAARRVAGVDARSCAAISAA